MSSQETWRLGTILGEQYRVDSIIGVGSVGTVFKGWHLRLEKDIAIKVIHTSLATDRTANKRFEREARAASHLNHPNCLEVIDFGESDDGTVFMVMEFVNGSDLATILEKEFPLTQLRVVRIFRQATLALDLAHSEGIIHRDLKPENVMITQVHRVHPDMVKVLDFGIAKLLDTSSVSKDSFHTLTGMVPGTPHYMSPEQAQGQALDGRSDLYAIGIMLYELITGRVPFDAKSPMKVIAMHLQYKPDTPRKYFPGIHEDLETLIMALLEKDRNDRPESAGQVAQTLEAIEKKLYDLPKDSGRVRAERADPTVRPTLQNLSSPQIDHGPWPKALMVGCLIAVGIVLFILLL
jgi:serine/threonine protein kinase